VRRLLDVAFIVVVAAVALLVWAGQQTPPDRYLEAIQERGTLRVGIDPTYPPFDMVEGGQVTGYDAALAEVIAADLGVRVEFKTLALDTLYDALAADQVDVLISALPFIYERQKEVRYSPPYYRAGQEIVVRHGAQGIASAGDLQGNVVGVELGSNADTEARRLTRTSLPGMMLRPIYHSAEDALNALVAGELEAVITDNTSAQTYARAHAGALDILSPPLTDEPYVIVMPVRASGLAVRIEATINRLRASGELEQIMSP
jgi:polar amino acid transport system substrate-binding protein